MTARVQLKKKAISGRESQVAWRQDKMLGGESPESTFNFDCKSPVIK
jgi:hypothetical protein